MDLNVLFIRRIRGGLGMDSKINPDHYKIGGIETIDYIEAKLTKEQFRGYLVGNVIKYISRFEHKNGLEDLKKAGWYLNRLIKTYSKLE
jgi:hypothetical protein